MALLCRPRQLPRAQLVPVVGDPRVYQLAKTRFRPALQGLLDPMNHLWDLPQVAPVITSRRLAERAAAGRKAQVRRRCSGADPPLRKSGGATGPFPLSGATTGTRYGTTRYTTGYGRRNYYGYRYRYRTLRYRYPVRFQGTRTWWLELLGVQGGRAWLGRSHPRVPGTRVPGHTFLFHRWGVAVQYRVTGNNQCG